MKLLLRLGLRNIGRNRLRSFLTMAAVGLCAAGIIVYSTLFAGMMDMMFDLILKENGHVQLLHTKLAEKRRLGAGIYFVEDVDKKIKKIKRAFPDLTVVPRVTLGGYVTHKPKGAKEDKQTPAMGKGIDPRIESEVKDLKKKMMPGGRVLRAKGKEVVLGKELASMINAKVGSSIVIMGQTVNDSISGLRLKVVGITDWGNPVQNKIFFVSLASAQYFLDIPNQVSSIVIYTKAMWQSRKTAAALKALKLGKDVTVQPWQESPFAAYALPLMSIMLFILGGFVVVIGGVGLLNTMMMSVIERRSEVGIMMALGLTPGRITSVFLFEGVTFGVFGALAGALLGILGSLPLVIWGISFGAEATAKMPVPMESTIRGAITVEGVVIGIAVGVLATVVGTLWPAIQASRLNPVDVLRK